MDLKDSRIYHTLLEKLRNVRTFLTFQGNRRECADCPIISHIPREVAFIYNNKGEVAECPNIPDIPREVAFIYNNKGEVAECPNIPDIPRDMGENVRIVRLSLTIREKLRLIRTFSEKLWNVRLSRTFSEKLRNVRLSLTIRLYANSLLNHVAVCAPNDTNTVSNPLPPERSSGQGVEIGGGGPTYSHIKNSSSSTSYNRIKNSGLSGNHGGVQISAFSANRKALKIRGFSTEWLGVRIRADQGTKSYFVNTAGGSRYAVGVGGAVTGMHGHFIIVDDPLDPERAVSEVELATANRWMSETLSQRKVDKAVVPTILIMQRLHQNDPTNMLLEKSVEGGIKHICLPAFESEKINPPYLKRFYKDGLLDPVRLPRNVLEDNRRHMGEYGFSGQFMQWPVPLGGGMFKTDRIKLEEKAPNVWAMRVRYWDKAGTENKPGSRAAYTAGVLMGRDCNKPPGFWILNVIRGRWDSASREAVIKQTARIDGKKVRVYVEQEPGSGGKESAESTIKNLAGFRVYADRPSGDKTLRADPFSVQVNANNVSMLVGAWNYDYLGELQFFPASTYKDQVDASSGAFAQVVKGKIRVGGAW